MAASILSSLAISIALYALFDLGRVMHNLGSMGYSLPSILFLYTDLHTIALTVLTEGSSAAYSFCFAHKCGTGYTSQHQTPCTS